MEISKEDLECLKELEKSDPEFVSQYLGENMKIEESYLSTSECAKKLGVCHSSILYYIRTGKLKAKQENGHWKIRETDFLNNKIKQKGDSMSKIYSKHSAQNVIDFLHQWDKSSSAGFSLPTITREFNQKCSQSVTEGQMSGILGTLKRKEFIISKGRGLYQVHPGFLSASSTSTSTSASADPVHSIPSAMDRDYSQFKKQERRLIDKFLDERANDNEDFYFTIDDVIAEYPMERSVGSKALQNMSYNGKLDRGEKLGVYIKRATIHNAPIAQKVAPAPTVQSTNKTLDKIREIMNSNLDESLKTEIIRKLV